MSADYLYRMCGGFHEEIQDNLKRLGVAYDFAIEPNPDAHWGMYKVSREEAKKLPDADGPYLPIDHDMGGYGLYEDPKAEEWVQRYGMVWKSLEQ